MSSHTLLEKCCFLADTAAGNPTHYMIEQALEQAELDWRFLTCEVNPDALGRALDGLEVLGFRGVMLSPQLRTPAAEVLSSLTPRARRAGSVNCLVREGDQLIGDDTFGAAFVESLGGAEALEGKQLMLIGSGRLAQAIAAAAGEAGAAALYLAHDDEQQLAELVEQVSAESQQELSVEAILVEGNIARVPAGVSDVAFAPLDEEQSPRPVIDTTAADQPLTFVDTRLRGSRTGLLKFAAQEGATIVDGVDLFARETALALELWTGLPFDRAPLRELAEEFLGV